MRQQTGSVKFAGINENAEIVKDFPREEERILGENEEEIEEVLSVDSDIFKPELKDRNFEFTDNIGLMRLLRMSLFLQIIAIIVDNESLKVPLYFGLLVSSGCRYVLHFYSRPFLDICYILQVFDHFLIRLINNLYNKIPTNKISSIQRKLTTIQHFFDFTVHMDLLDDQNWHTAQYYVHFFLGFFFLFLTLYITLTFWEIPDYSDRDAVRKFLNEYVADGWYRRGGLKLASLLLFWCGMSGLLLILIYFCAMRFTTVTPDSRFIGTYVYISCAIVLILWFIGMIMIREVERVFVRYVSQNVNYTSTIILKRVLKSKIEIGLSLLILLFCPTLYYFVNTTIVLTDWDDVLALVHRANVNYHVPCYFYAFPPYRKPMSRDNCAVSYALSSTQSLRPGGFYKDIPILQCDTYLGYTMFTLAIIGLVFTIIIIFWIVRSFIVTNDHEMKLSRWFEPVAALKDKLESDRVAFKEDFPWTQRLLIATRFERRMQQKYFKDGLRGIYIALIFLVTTCESVVRIPLTCIAAPFIFCGRSLFVSCGLLTYHPSKHRQPKMIKQSSFSSLLEDSSSESSVWKKCFGRCTRLTKGCCAPVSKLCHCPCCCGSISGWRRNQLLRSSPSSRQIHSRGGSRWRNRYFSRCLQIMLYPLRSICCCFFRNKEEVKASNQRRIISMMSRSANRDREAQKAVVWRELLTVQARYKAILKGISRLEREYKKAKQEFVTDHTLAISLFDRVLDTAGTFLLVAPFKVYTTWWFLVVLLEMCLYSIVSGCLAYYLLWQFRALSLAGICIIFGVLTYAYNPFTDDIDKWIDWVGRVIVVLVVLGLILCEVFSPELLVTQIRTPAAKHIFDVVVTNLKSLVVLGLDVLLVLAIYIYVFTICHIVGVFDYLKRMFDSLKYAMHDHVLNEMVVIAGQTRIGYENVNIGLALLQQWDDIIHHQRRRALLSWPDVRPPNLMTIKMKCFEVKWAAAFNLTVANVRTSLGLNLLHPIICTANSDVAKWIIELHPELLTTEDTQRDTPLSIGLKECAFLLAMYAGFNNGNLEDDTSYADDEFDEVYPEVMHLRRAVEMSGEFIAEFAEVYNLNPKEANELRDTGTFKQLRKTIPADANAVTSDLLQRQKYNAKSGENYALKSRNLNSQNRRGGGSTLGGSYGRGGRGGGITGRGGISQKTNEVKDAGGVAVETRRYPEDNTYEDMDGGQLASWRVLKISVTDNLVDLDNTFMNDDLYDDDLKISAGGMYGISKVNATEMLTTTVQGWEDITLDKAGQARRAKLLQDDAVVLSKQSVVKMSVMEALSHNVTVATRRPAHGGKARTFGKAVYPELEVRWKVCKFAEIMLSDQVANVGKTLQWNTNTYKEFNKQAVRMHGILAQQLAVCFNLNPPSGFSCLADWSLGSSGSGGDSPPDNQERNIFEEDLGNATAHDNNNNNNDDTQSHMNQSILTRTVKAFGKILRRMKDAPLPADAFNDRIIQYLAEVCVSSRQVMDLSECQLSGPARVAWRAICRALRRKFCSFVVPSVFTPCKPIFITHIYLQKNELDCGDAVLVGEALKQQQTVILLDVSFNRIGARGFGIIVKSIKGHTNLTTFRIHHNRLGPSAGKDIGTMLKQSRTLKVVDFSHNRLGELVRYSTKVTREVVPSAARDIFMGLRSNRNLCSFDVSYNNLGPKCAEVVPLAIMRHPTMRSLNISGNDIGSIPGSRLLWNLAGLVAQKANNDNTNDDTDEAGKDNSKSERTSDAPPASSRTARSARSQKSRRSRRSNRSGTSARDDGKPAAKLSELCMADNQLGPVAGLALAEFLRRSSNITAIDVSNNSLGHKGGRLILASIVEQFGISLSVAGSKSIKFQYYPPSLIHLNLARNGLGPDTLHSFGMCLNVPSCTLTSLDLSGNPLGRSISVAGNITQAITSIRQGLGRNTSLRILDVSNSLLPSTHLLTLFGAVSSNRHLIKINFKNILLDEPCCLMLARALETCITIQTLDIPNAKMGPKGGSFVCLTIERIKHRLRYVDISGSFVGALSIQPVTRAILDPTCTISSLLLGSNDLGVEGGKAIVSALVRNNTISHIDLSNNNLTEGVAAQLADDYKILVTTSGREAYRSNLRRISFSNNPLIGKNGSRILIASFASETMEHLELANVGAGPRAAAAVADSLNNVTVAWKVLDVSRNVLGRLGLNRILWAVRSNRRLKALKMGSNEAGLSFGTDADLREGFGVALPRAVQNNLTIVMLDLSHNGLTSEAAINLFTALKANMSIQRLSVRGNLLDDDVAVDLGTLLSINDVIQELDIGNNKLGYQSCFSIAEGLQVNRSVKILFADKNKLGSAGPATMEIFWTALCANFSLRVLNLDENRLAAEWTIKLADAFARNASLIQVTLRNNRLDSRAGEALLRSYKHNYHLVELVVSEDEVGGDVFKLIQDVFNQKKAFESPNTEDSKEALVERQRALMFDIVY